MIRWAGDSHATPDFHDDGVWLRLNSALYVRAECSVVGDWRNRRAVVLEKVQFPRWAKGYHSLVPTNDVAMNCQDRVDELKKKASAQQHLRNRRRDTVVARRTVIRGVRRGLWVLSMLLGRRRIGGLIATVLIILVWVLAAHGGAAKKEWGISLCGLAFISVSEGVTCLEGFIRTTGPFIGRLDSRLPQIHVRCQVDIDRMPSSV